MDKQLLFTPFIEYPLPLPNPQQHQNPRLRPSFAVTPPKSIPAKLHFVQQQEVDVNRQGR